MSATTTTASILLLDAMLAVTTRMMQLKAIHEQMAAEGRTDLNDAELAILRNDAVQAVKGLGAAVDSNTQP